MNKIKRIGALLMCLGLLFGAAACGPKESDDQLLIWTFSDETVNMEEKFEAKYPEVDVVVKEYPMDVFQTRLDNALRKGTDMPDIVVLEISFVKKYVESGRLMDLTALGLKERADEELYEYTVDIGTAEDGNLYAISNQAAPGGFFYRRSMAKELWGDDSPEFVQQKLSTWEGFLDVAAELKSNGKKIVSNLNAAEKVFLCERETGWVKDDVLQVDPCWDTYLELIRTMQDEGYSNETVEYGAGGGWYTDISGNEVFGYFLGAWGLHYHLKSNAVNGEYSSENDWGIVQGPYPFYTGGTWYAGVKGSDKQEEIKNFMQYFMFDQEYLQGEAKKNGDFIGNKITVSALKDTFADPFLQGQNHYQIFSEIADQISAKNVTVYDGSIGSMFSEVAVQYAMRELNTLQDAYAQFKDYVKNAYTDIKTD